MPEINMTFIGVVLVVFLALTTIDAQNGCSNSTNCINVRKCPAILEILKGSKPLSEETLQTLRNAQCSFEGNDPMICCTNQVTTTIPLTMTSEPETTPAPPDATPAPPDVTVHPNLRLLDHQMCGPINQLKLIGGNKTGVFQFPWIALIMYDVGKANPVFRCGGTIISSRYILTAAHCVSSLPAGLRLLGVRVGDHDVSKERDCEKDSQGLESRCAERYQNFGMDNFYYHPEYTTTKLQNDIALIRLNGSVDFRADNVRPICLPFGVAATINTRKAIVTGWGATKEGPRSLVLLQAKLPLIPYEQCKEIYKQSVQIWHKQLCAGGERGVDSCRGDSGGPLQAPGIYNDRSVRMVQYGLVSYGLRECGTAGFPGVYTRISYYMDWILNTMTD